ncbi:MAG: hypothetical protein WCY30_02265 [Candidatus Neomarinimicrobiota bacterium]|jgi:hypothetical protein
MILAKAPDGFIVGRNLSDIIGLKIIDYVFCDILFLFPGMKYLDKKITASDCDRFNSGLTAMGRFDCIQDSHGDIAHIRYVPYFHESGKYFALCGQQGEFEECKVGPTLLCPECQYMYWQSMEGIKRR